MQEFHLLWKTKSVPAQTLISCDYLRLPQKTKHSEPRREQTLEYPNYIQLPVSIIQSRWVLLVSRKESACANPRKDPVWLTTATVRLLLLPQPNTEPEREADIFKVHDVCRPTKEYKGAEFQWHEGGFQSLWYYVVWFGGDVSVYEEWGKLLGRSVVDGDGAESSPPHDQHGQTKIPPPQTQPRLFDAFI